MRFKIGDRIKCIYRVEFQLTKINSIYTVTGYRENGNVILEELPLCAYDPNDFELVDKKIKNTELRINNIAEKIKKEGNEMIESMNLIDLYANKHKENIEKETKEKIEELRKKCDVINKYNELQEKYKNELKELYLSQFTEEEKAQIVLGNLTDEDKQLKNNLAYLDRYCINNSFKPDGYENLMDERSEKINELNDLVKMVKAHIGIAKTKEEVEEILTRYGIIDKKGKLVIK